MKFLKSISYFSISLLFYACVNTVAHRPFVASSFEPLTINKKGAKQGSVSLRPIKYASGDFTYGLTNHLVMRLNAGGTLGLGIFSGALLYNDSLKKTHYFVGGLFNYQTNQIHRELANLTGTGFKNYDYSCQYYSPGLVTGISFMGEKQINHHFILKAHYNFVQSYSYNYQAFDRYDYLKNEQLNYKIPDFLSCELSYARLIHMKNNKSLFKFQIGGHLTQKTLKHHYEYNSVAPYTGGRRIKDGIDFHPVSFPLNISVGFIFSSGQNYTN
jgi:hypothetical protein